LHVQIFSFTNVQVQRSVLCYVSFFVLEAMRGLVNGFQEFLFCRKSLVLLLCKQQNAPREKQLRNYNKQ